LPPGTSKWNKLEPAALFHQSEQAWQAGGQSSIDRQSDSRDHGLRVRAEVDPGKYPKGVKVSNKEVANLRIERDKFHGEWNYTILSRSD
jgi:hypothetical protein